MSHGRPRDAGSHLPGDSRAGLRTGPPCPRCGRRRVWLTWFEPVTHCPGCGWPLGGRGRAAAVWVNTWVATLAVMLWIMGGLVATAFRGAWWIGGGALTIAVVLPPVTYRYATAAVGRLISALDTPEGAAADTRSRSGH